MRHALSRNRSLNRDSVIEDLGSPITLGSFDYDEPPPEDESSTLKVHELLKRFREEGRFEYNHEQKNIVEIKYW